MALLSAGFAAVAVVALPGIAHATAPSTVPTTVTVSGTSGTVTLTATLDVSSTATSVEFKLDDGSVLGTGTVASGSATLDWSSWGYSNGSHTVTAYECVSTDCNTAGTTSDSFTLANAVPVITSPATGTTSQTTGYALAATSAGGSIQFRIDGNPVGFAASSPYTATYPGPALTDGPHSFTAVQCAVSDDTHCNGPESAAHTVTVDTTPPTLSSVSGTPTTFYPYPDGYKDTFAAAVTVGEASTLRLVIKNSVGGTVRSFQANVTPGRRGFTWNGRRADNSFVPAGTYRWLFIATDAQHNTRMTAAYPVYVSSKRLVKKTKAITEGGNQYIDSLSAPVTCSSVSKSRSTFAPNGALMTSTCSKGGLTLGVYNFRIPSAIRYGYTSLQTYGYSHHGYTPVRLVPLVYSPVRDEVDQTSRSYIQINGTTKAWRSLGSISTVGHYDSRHTFQVGLIMVNKPGYKGDYDMHYLRINVTYWVLQ